MGSRPSGPRCPVIMRKRMSRPGSMPFSLATSDKRFTKSPKPTNTVALKSRINITCCCERVSTPVPALSICAPTQCSKVSRM